MSSDQPAPMIFVATPCFGGLVTTGYMMSIVKLMQYAGQHKFSVSLNLLGRDSLITRARNTLVAQFMTVPQATHLMFIDADIGFEPELVHRMLAFDEDVVGGMYPAKALNWNPPDKIAYSEPPNLATLNYVGKFCERDELERRGPFATGVYAATGFMMIKRAGDRAPDDGLSAIRLHFRPRLHAGQDRTKILRAVRMPHRSGHRRVSERRLRLLSALAQARRQNLARRRRRAGTHWLARLRRQPGAALSARATSRR